MHLNHGASLLRKTPVVKDSDVLDVNCVIICTVMPNFVLIQFHKMGWSSRSSGDFDIIGLQVLHHDRVILGPGW